MAAPAKFNIFFYSNKIPIDLDLVERKCVEFLLVAFLCRGSMCYAVQTESGRPHLKYSPPKNHTIHHKIIKNQIELNRTRVSIGICLSK
jgi:hypothetical protein